MGARGGLHRHPLFWIALLTGSFAGIAIAKETGTITPTLATLLMLCAMFLMVPVVRTSSVLASCNTASVAAVRYMRRLMVFSALYVAGLAIAIPIDRHYDLSGGLAFLVALLPAAPTIGIVATMGRYLVEESDEYLRHREMIANIFGLGAVLAIGSFWGFLEKFGVVDHAAGYWTVPIWAVGMGLGQAILALRDRQGAEDGE